MVTKWKVVIMFRKKISTGILILALILSLIPFGTLTSYADGYTLTFGSNIDAGATLKCVYRPEEWYIYGSNLAESPIQTDQIGPLFMVYMPDYNREKYCFDGWEINGELYDEERDHFNSPEFPDNKNVWIDLCIDKNSEEFKKTKLHDIPWYEIPEEDQEKTVSCACLYTNEWGLNASQWYPKDIDIKAVFSERKPDEAPYEVTVEAVPEDGGDVKAEFIKKSGSDDIWKLLASKPKEGYYLEGWRKKGSEEILSPNFTYEVTVSGDSTYEAVFFKHEGPTLNIGADPAAELPVKCAYYDPEWNIVETDSDTIPLSSVAITLNVYIPKYDTDKYSLIGWRINDGIYGTDVPNSSFGDAVDSLRTYLKISENAGSWYLIPEEERDDVAGAVEISYNGSMIKASDWLGKALEIKALVVDKSVNPDYAVTGTAYPASAGTAEAAFLKKNDEGDCWILKALDPNEGWIFKGWRAKGQSEIVSTAKTFDVTVSGDSEFEAVYEPVEYVLDMSRAAIQTTLPVENIFLENASAVIDLERYQVEGYDNDTSAFFDPNGPGTVRIFKGSDCTGEELKFKKTSTQFEFIMPLSDSITVECSYKSGEGIKTLSKTFENLETVSCIANQMGLSYMTMPYAGGAYCGPVYQNMGPDFSENIFAAEDGSGDISLYASTGSGNLDGTRFGSVMRYSGNNEEYNWEMMPFSDAHTYKYDYSDTFVDGTSSDNIVFYTNQGHKKIHTLLFLNGGKWEDRSEIIRDKGVESIEGLALFAYDDIYFLTGESHTTVLWHYDGISLTKKVELPVYTDSGEWKLNKLDEESLLIAAGRGLYRYSRKANELTKFSIKGDAVNEKNLYLYSVDLFNGGHPRAIIGNSVHTQMKDVYEWNIATGETALIDTSVFNNKNLQGSNNPRPIEVSYACDGYIYAITAGDRIGTLGGNTQQGYLWRLSGSKWNLCSTGNTVQEPQPEAINEGVALVNPVSFRDIVNPAKDVTLFVGQYGTMYCMGSGLFGGISGVSAKLEALPEPEAVELLHRSQIEEAESMVNALTEEQKAKIDPVLIEKLEKDVEALKALIDAQPQDAGHVYVTAENLTHSDPAHGWETGFILPPTVVEIEPGDTPATVLKRVLTEKNLQTSVHSSYGFYVEGIRSPLNTGEMLCEFDGGGQSGWMYMVNNSFPSVGAGSYGLMKDGDVMRWQYTSYGYGSDLGGGVGGGAGVFGNKDTLVTAIALVNALGEQEKYGDDYTKAIAVLTQLGASQDKINEALLPFAGLVKINDHSTVEALIDKIPSPVTLESKAAIDTARKAYDDLGKAEKAKVLNYDKLLTAENEFAVLSVADMIEKLPEISKLTEVDSSDVATAKDAFDALGEEQKSKISEELSDKLDKAVKRIAELREALVSKFEDIYKSTGGRIVSFGDIKFGGEWMSLGLARSGYEVPKGYFDKYLDDVAATLKEKNGNLLGKSGKKYTEYERTILALTALGVDVRNVAGYNLLTWLTDYDKVTWQGLNAADFALIALDSHDYEIPAVSPGGNQMTRGKLIDNILDAEISKENGSGWAYSGDKADPDMTAMTLQALTPYYLNKVKFDEAKSSYSFEELKAAVERGISVMSEIQNSDGGYASWGSVNSESCAQVLVALTGLGIDPVTDPRFTKSAGNPLTAMLSFYVEGGGFKHIASGELNGMATEQAYYAMAAYSRFKENKTALYDMTDIEIKAYISSYVKPDEKPQPAPDKKPQDNTSQRPQSNNNATKGGTVTKTADSSKPADKDDAAKMVTELINALSKPTDKSKALPENFDELTPEQEKAIIEAFKQYQSLSAEDKKKVANYHELKAMTEKLGIKYHYDEASKLDLRDNDEKVLPWNIKLVVTHLTETGKKFAKLGELVGNDKKVMCVLDISFVNMLTGEEWHPDDALMLKLPAPELGEGYDSVVIAHLDDSEKLEYIEARVIDGELVFASASFSIYATVAYNGGWDSLVGMEKINEESAANAVRIWIVLAIIAAICVVVTAYEIKRKKYADSSKVKRSE